MLKRQLPCTKQGTPGRATGTMPSAGIYACMENSLLTATAAAWDGNVWSSSQNSNNNNNAWNVNFNNGNTNNNNKNNNNNVRVVRDLAQGHGRCSHRPLLLWNLQ